jgi:hypothetical protein
MKNKERMRDVLPDPPGVEYWNQKVSDGWKLIAIEWERGTEPARAGVPWIEDIPYGMKVAADGLHLIENPAERETLTLMLEMIVADKSFSEVAECVNSRGLHMRSGAKWTQVDIFELLPRLVEVAPRIYPTHEWSERRDRIFRLAKGR